MIWYVLAYCLIALLTDLGILWIASRFGDADDYDIYVTWTVPRLLYSALWPLSVPLILAIPSVVYLARLVIAIYSNTLYRLEQKVTKERTDDV